MWAKIVNDSGKKYTVRHFDELFLPAFLCSSSIFLLIKITRYVQLNDELPPLKRLSIFLCIKSKVFCLFIKD